MTGSRVGRRENTIQGRTSEESGMGSCSGSHSWSPRSLRPAPNHWTASGSPQFQRHLCLQPWLTACSAQGWADLTHILPGLQRASQAVSVDTEAGQSCERCPRSTLHSPKSLLEQPHWAGCRSAVSRLPSEGHKAWRSTALLSSSWPGCAGKACPPGGQILPSHSLQAML